MVQKIRIEVEARRPRSLRRALPALLSNLFLLFLLLLLLSVGYVDEARSTPPKNLLYEEIFEEGPDYFRPGDKVVATAYCSSKKSAERLAVHVALYGRAGYFRAMVHRPYDCFDTRLHPDIKPVETALIEIVFVLVLKPNEGLQFWRSTDHNGIDLIVWTQFKYQEA